MNTAKPYLGVEGRDSSSGACAGRGVTAWNDPAAELRKAAGCSRTSEDVAGDTGRILMSLMRDGTGAEQLGGGRGAPIVEPGAGLAKGRVQPDHCRQALSCRRLAREFEGRTFAS